MICDSRLLKTIKTGPKPKAWVVQQTAHYHCVRNWSWCRPLRPLCAWIRVGWHHSTLWRPWRTRRRWPVRPSRACIPGSCEGWERVTEKGAASEHSIWPFRRWQNVWNIKTSSHQVKEKVNQTLLHICLYIPLLLTKTTKISERFLSLWSHNFWKTRQLGDEGAQNRRRLHTESTPVNLKWTQMKKTWHILCRNAAVSEPQRELGGGGVDWKVWERGGRQIGHCCGRSPKQPVELSPPLCTHL